MDEISVPLEYGYSFPLKVFSTVKPVPLSEDCLQEYKRLKDNLNLGKGELEAIAYCKMKNGIFVTNDAIARKYAIEEGVTVISLQAILRSLWKKKLKTKEEVKQILKQVKDADNLELNKEFEKEVFG